MRRVLLTGSLLLVSLVMGVGFGQMMVQDNVVLFQNDEPIGSELLFILRIKEKFLVDETILETVLDENGFELLEAIEGFDDVAANLYQEFFQITNAEERNVADFLANKKLLPLPLAADQFNTQRSELVATIPCNGEVGRVRVKNETVSLYDASLADRLVTLQNALQVAMQQSGETIEELHPGGSPTACSCNAQTGTPGNEDPTQDAIAAVNRPSSSGGGTGVMVAVIDTGIDVAINTPRGLDLNGNFALDLVQPTLGSAALHDPFIHPVTRANGHGTIVAQIIGELAPEAQFLSIRVCDAMGSCRGSRLIFGMCYAAAVAKTLVGESGQPLPLVINLSLDGAYADLQRQTRRQISDPYKSVLVDLTQNEGVAIAAAVGNSGDAYLRRYPAAFRLLGGCNEDAACVDGLIATSALRPILPVELADQKWIPTAGSTRGGFVELAAPGYRMLWQENPFNVPGIPDPAHPDQPFTGYTGTSFSTALVSGALALMRGENANLSPTALEQCLLNSAANSSTTTAPIAETQLEVGRGLLNIAGAFSVCGLEE